MHDAFTIGVPTFVVLMGILFNRNEIRDLRADMNWRFDDVTRRFEEVDKRFGEVSKRFDDVNKRLDRVDSDLKIFDRITARLEGRVDELSRR